MAKNSGGLVPTSSQVTPTSRSETVSSVSITGAWPTYLHRRQAQAGCLRRSKNIPITTTPPPSTFPGSLHAGGDCLGDIRAAGWQTSSAAPPAEPRLSSQGYSSSCSRF